MISLSPTVICEDACELLIDVVQHDRMHGQDPVAVHGAIGEVDLVPLGVLTGVKAESSAQASALERAERRILCLRA